MKKYLILLLIALGSFVSVHAQKFALIDMEYIMRNIPAYERAGEQLNQISKKWQAEVEALDNEAKTLYRNYQNEAVFLSEAQKKDREDKIVKKEKDAADLKKKYFGPEGELYKKRTALLQPIQDEVYNAVKAVVPNMPNVFVFDTSFHQTMPAKAYMYAVPYEYYQHQNIRRWGAHGTSHRFVTDRVCRLLGVKPEEQKIVTCHIGNGASVSAVDGGKCVDTSMGLTPLEGLMMGTRTGDVDASVVLAIMKSEGLDPDQMQTLLNKKSGLLGISGISSDMREVETAAQAGNERARLALEMYSYRIKKYIGAYAAAMGGLDTIVFTAGVGEHQWDIRYNATKGLEFLGVKVDYEVNRANFGDEQIISTPDSRVKVVVVPTDEELLIASDTLALVQH